MAPSGFMTGDKVEVRSDDDGFRDAWFEAKVARYMPKLQRYTIVYDAIMDDADESRPLRETVDARHVRPRPPARRPAGGSFALHQTVDAFYNDGWWLGVVSWVAEKGRQRRYTVAFPSTQEEMEFAASNLRPHLEWIDGEWVLPETQNKLDVELREDAVVEVSSDDEGFRGAWYTATIIKLIGKKKFLVEYQDLKTDDETKPLTETVDFQHIRPCPPENPVVEQFKLLEEVDAFYNDGWWVGVISKVLKGQRYVVYFKPWNEEMEFGHKELRLHHDWIDGRWLRSTEALKSV